MAYVTARCAHVFRRPVHQQPSPEGGMATSPKGPWRTGRTHGTHTESFAEQDAVLGLPGIEMRLRSRLLDER